MVSPLPFLLAGTLASAQPSPGGFCGDDPAACAAVRSATDKGGGVEPGLLASYHASSYLACLKWSGTAPAGFPAGHPWPRILEGYAHRLNLYAAMAASFAGDRGAALEACRRVLRPGLDGEACGRLYAAYRSYYSPFCRVADAPAEDLGAAEAEHLCRTHIYPDAKSCSRVRDPANRDRCEEALAFVLARGRPESPECLGSPLCRAYYGRDRKLCAVFRERLLAVAAEAEAEAGASPPEPGAGDPRARSKAASDAGAEKLKAGDPEGAARLMRAALSVWPENPEAGINLCVIEQRLGRPGPAAELCLAAAEAAAALEGIGMARLAADARLLGAELLAGLGRREEAAGLLRLCLKEAPSGWPGRDKAAALAAGIGAKQ